MSVERRAALDKLWVTSWSATSRRTRRSNAVASSPSHAHTSRSPSCVTQVWTGSVAAEARHPSSSGLNVETLTVHNVLRAISMISYISTFGPMAERWRTTHEMPNRMVGGDTKACSITVNSAYTGGWRTSPPCVEWRENIIIPRLILLQCLSLARRAHPQHPHPQPTRTSKSQSRRRIPYPRSHFPLLPIISP